MFEPYNRHLLEIIEKYSDPNRPALNSHQIGHRNMLENALLAFYQSGHTGQAERIYKQLRELYPDRKFEVPMMVFAKKSFLEELSSMMIFDAKEIVQMLLQETYFRYAMHDDDEAAGREKIAEEVYEFYNKSYSDTNRVPLPKLSRMRYLALRDFLFDGQYAQELRNSLFNRIQIERPELYKELKAEGEEMQREYQERLRENSQGPLR
jgi:hypothetical protein